MNNASNIFKSVHIYIYNMWILKSNSFNNATAFEYKTLLYILVLPVNGLPLHASGSQWHLPGLWFPCLWGILWSDPSTCPSESCCLWRWWHSWLHLQLVFHILWKTLSKRMCLKIKYVVFYMKYHRPILKVHMKFRIIF